jgi:hypothetical protein
MTRRRSSPQLDAAAALLRRLLADGAVRATEVQRQCIAAGVSLRTLDSAKRLVGVLAERRASGTRAAWWWRARPAEFGCALAQSPARLPHLEDARPLINIRSRSHEE